MNAIDEADTFDKVLLAAKMLHGYIQDRKQDKQETDDAQQQQGNASNESEQQSNQASGSNTQDDGDADQDGEGADDIIPEANDEKPDEEQSTTQQEFDKNSERLNSSSTSYMSQVVYVSPTELPIIDRIVPIQTLRYTTSCTPSWYSECVLDNFKQFLSGIKRDVNFMVLLFEMRKSADAYARTQEHKTGVLNTNALHNYQLTDDVFLRHNVTADGKNHGMVMLIDWSGSMDDILLPTVKQVIVLAQFCRKAGIPFDVYTFTSGGNIGWEDNLAKKLVIRSNQNVLSSSAKRGRWTTFAISTLLLHRI